MRGKIDTESGWLRVVRTRPVSYEWSNQVKTTLDMNGKPEETSLALTVGAVNHILECKPVKNSSAFALRA